MSSVLKANLRESKAAEHALACGRIEASKINNNAIKKEQRKHLKKALSGLPLTSFLIAMGATSLKVDQKSKNMFGVGRGLTNERRTLEAVADNKS